MGRTCFAVVCLTLSVLALSGSAHALRYTVTDLNVPVGSVYDRIWVTGVNNSGQVVGWVDNYQTNGKRGWVYRDGATEFLDMVGPVCEVRAINDAGVIAGSCTTAGWRPYVWQGESMSQLPMPASASFAEAWAMNNNGQFAGYCQTTNFYPCTWDATGAHVFAATPGRLHDLADNGMAVGQTLESSPRALVVHNGATSFLSSLGGSESVAYAVNESGAVVGYSMVADGKAHACIWRNGIPQDLGVPVSQTSLAMDINESGVVVGFCGPAPGMISARAAYVWVDGVAHNLNDLIPTDCGWGITAPSVINDEGQIVGIGVHNGVGAAFLLTPEVPEPTGAAVLIAGVACTRLLRRKRA